MLLKRSAIVLVLFALLAGTMAVSVSADDSNSHSNDGNAGYSTSPGTPDGSGTILPMSVSDYIRQFETKWYTRSISGHPYSFRVDLYWGTLRSQLRMRIYTPDGYILGPFYDNYDGMYNGDIPVEVYRQGGVADGNYSIEVYGMYIPWGALQWFSLN